jgi:hypothetical protein
MPGTLLPANACLRKQALLWGTCIAVVGAGGILALGIYLERLTASPQVAAQSGAGYALSVLFLAEAVIMIPVLSLAGMLSYLALRVWRSGQYPPPGMEALRDTKIRTGQAARGIAKVCLLLVVLVLLCGVGMGLLMRWILSEPARPSLPPRWQSPAVTLSFDGQAPVPSLHTSRAAQ